jgi:hypothetical protein
MDEILTAEVDVLFTLNSDVEGFRRSLGTAAYRPNHKFADSSEFFIGFVEFEGGECNPGETIKAKIMAIYSSYMDERFVVGEDWMVMEGPLKHVGNVHILGVARQET